MATSLDGERGLRQQDLPTPTCGPDQVRIAVRAVALNFPDVLITRGQYQLRLDPPFVPGSEAAGVIAEVGSNIEGFTVGDRVLAICGAGAFAEEIVVAPPMQQVYRIPDAMGFPEAAGFGMVHGTAMHGLRQRGQLQPGETVLVLGAGGGCGSAAVSVATAMGARVIAVASTPDKGEFAVKLGARASINHREEQLRERVMELTDGAGVDVVFDPVGGDLFDHARRCLGWNGRYLVIGFAAGEIPAMRANYTILKSISMIGVAFGMSALKDPTTAGDNFADLFRWYGEGSLRTAPGVSLPFAALPQACADLYAGNAIGKTVIEIDGTTR